MKKALSIRVECQTTGTGNFASNYNNKPNIILPPYYKDTTECSTSPSYLDIHVLLKLHINKLILSMQQK
jgi:hypothetical protein